MKELISNTMANWRWFMFVAFLCGCAAIDRDCSSCEAKTTGADWVVVQLRADGEVTRCWKLHGAAIVNEEASDGIFWQDPEGGGMVHISGWYNRVQVANGKWDDAARSMGVDIKQCSKGSYQPAAKPSVSAAVSP